MDNPLDKFKSIMRQLRDKITWMTYDAVTPNDLRALARAAEDRARELEGAERLEMISSKLREIASKQNEAQAATIDQEQTERLRHREWAAKELAAKDAKISRLSEKVESFHEQVREIGEGHCLQTVYDFGKMEARLEDYGNQIRSKDAEIERLRAQLDLIIEGPSLQERWSDE